MRTQTLIWHKPDEKLPDAGKLLLFKTSKVFWGNTTHVGRYFPVSYPHQYDKPEDFAKWDTNLSGNDIRSHHVVEWAYLDLI